MVIFFGPFPKLKSFCYDWRDKRKFETGGDNNTKKSVSELFWGLEKRRIISEGDFFKGDKIVIYEQINMFRDSSSNQDLASYTTHIGCVIFKQE